MKEFVKMTVMLVIAASVIFIAASVAESTNTPDTTIKKYIDKEANMMCYYTDTWGSCFYVLED